MERDLVLNEGQYQTCEGDMAPHVTIPITYSEARVCPIFCCTILVMGFIMTFDVLQGRLNSLRRLKQRRVLLRTFNFVLYLPGNLRG